tara:strand:- start:276 stop:464 length:189 start_codon:yes stop_codon:yes gene_type:complete
MKYLSDDMQRLLRANNIIESNEVASAVGDTYVAIDVVTNARRIINFDIQLLKESSTKRVLRG